MENFCLKDVGEYYLSLSEQPKRFDPDSSVTNVFFDDTNGEVFTVRSGGVTGVTVIGMDDKNSGSFRMEDKGLIISIKFSPDHNILAIQRSNENQNATIELLNFKDLEPTNVEYAHTCKWKSAKILGFVWPKANEIAFITDHGIELLQVLPEKKQLKSMKNVSFSGAWFAWCAQSKTVLLAGNNGALLQPFTLNNSTITKLQKLELDSGKPVVERDVFVLRLCDVTWCAVFRHMTAPGLTEVWLLPTDGPAATRHTHVLQTGLSGRFAVNIVDDLVVIHHQSSQTSQIFDILEESKVENNVIRHIPIVGGRSMKPARLGDDLCPMYAVTWVMFQPDYVVDVKLGCLWRIQLLAPTLAASIPKDEMSRIVAVLLRRTDGASAIYQILAQLVSEAEEYLVEIAAVFDEINAVYRKWGDMEMARQSGHIDPARASFKVVLTQNDICRTLQQSSHPLLVQVVTLYLSSLTRHEVTVQHPVAELVVRTLVTRGATSRLRSLVRRGCLGDSRPLSCQLLSLGHLSPACAQLAIDMMWRLKGIEEIVEVLLSWDEPISAIGAARQADPRVFAALPARKLLAAAKSYAERKSDPAVFAAVYRALRERNERIRGDPNFVKGEQCDSYVEYYKHITSDTL